MKHVWAVIALCLLSLSASAALVSRAGGQAYYDSVLNITWVADANLAQTSNYDVDGLMTWSDAQGWIASLNTASYLGLNNWRLPSTNLPDPSCSIQYNPGPPDPAWGYGTGCIGSEMGHLYNVDGIKTTTPAPFANLLSSNYWSGTESLPAITGAFTFTFDTGSGGVQNPIDKSNTVRAWAVSPGDLLAVPVPAAVWLFGSALGVMGVMRRKLSG